MQSFEELISIVKKLRGENGCAWDKVQTFDSLIPCFLEESYEVVDGISKRDYKNIKEELGDVLLHIVFFSELANDENKFNIDEVIKNINDDIKFSDIKVLKGNLQELPFPKLTKSQDELLSNLVTSIQSSSYSEKQQKKLDETVYSLFKITPTEQQQIKSRIQ